MSEWVSVKERLPENGERILVTDGIQICIAFIQKIKKRFTQINTWDDWIHESITHWQELPLLPETKTEKPTCPTCLHELQEPGYCDYCAMEIKQENNK